MQLTRILVAIFDLCQEIDLAIFSNKIEIISSLGLSTPNFHDVVFNSSIQGVACARQENSNIVDYFKIHHQSVNGRFLDQILN